MMKRTYGNFFQKKKYIRLDIYSFIRRENKMLNILARMMVYDIYLGEKIYYFTPYVGYRKTYTVNTSMNFLPQHLIRQHLRQYFFFNKTHSWNVNM